MPGVNIKLNFFFSQGDLNSYGDFVNSLQAQIIFCSREISVAEICYKLTF